MISQEFVECITKDMHKIGENKPIEVVVQNPSIIQKHKYLKAN